MGGLRLLLEIRGLQAASSLIYRRWFKAIDQIWQVHPRPGAMSGLRLSWVTRGLQADSGRIYRRWLKAIEHIWPGNRWPEHGWFNAIDQT
jgi:hypothetical protein